MSEVDKRRAAGQLVILIVDEQQVLIDLLVEQLISEQVRVIGATSAHQGKEHFEANNPDVLILDADLPDAFDLLQAVRSADTVCAILAITGSDEVRSRLDALPVLTAKWTSLGR